MNERGCVIRYMLYVIRLLKNKSAEICVICGVFSLADFANTRRLKISEIIFEMISIFYFYIDKIIRSLVR